MKVRIEIDCTPEEARRFMGLPDVTPVHDQMVEQMKKAAAGELPAIDPEAMMKMWFPMGGEALEELQKAFWGAAMTGAGGGTGGQKTKSGK